MAQPGRIQLLVGRVASLLLLPAGLVCVGVPFYMLTLPDRWGMIDDTQATLGAGLDGGRLRASYVDCTRERSGSNSTRGIAITEYGCVIDLSEAPEPTPVPPVAPKAKDKGGDRYAGLSYDESMKAYDAEMARWQAATAEQDRRNRAALDAALAQAKARSESSNRIERTLASDYSGKLPAVRILSAKGEPRRVGLVWGAGEIGFRWLHWLLISAVLFGFGAFCLFAVRLAWKPRPSPGHVHG